MDLCTVTNRKYIKNAINLVNSYKINSYNKNVFIYCFDMTDEQIKYVSNVYSEINFLSVPKVCDYAYNPTAFFYKVYAINDCINKSNGFIYSDATNAFNRFVDIKNYFIDDSLFLPYNHKFLLNKFWTTKKCFEKMDCDSAKNTTQYWAGLQVYVSTEKNKLFTQQMYNYMLDPDIALPDTSVKNPDGEKSICLEHRQDQSVFSLLIHKHNRHQEYNEERQMLFGDWMTYKSFNQDYKHDIKNCVISSRESKFGNFRFL
jgi:hypothetical protein